MPLRVPIQAVPADGEITKAAKPNVAPAATFSPAQVAALLNSVSVQPGTTGSYAPLPRTDPQVAFGPGLPLFPAAIDPPRRDTGRPEPRFNEYPVSANLPGINDRLVPWEILRRAADAGGVPRQCIEIRKDEVSTLDWAITITKDAIVKAQADDPSLSTSEAQAKLRKMLAPEIARCSAFWEKPDPGQGEDSIEWFSKLLEDHFVLDAVACYPHYSYGGGLWALEILDGSTIKVLRDHRGGRPLPPEPAFQQLLWGFPRGEFVADVTKDGQVINPYQADQLIYKRRNVRSQTIYGYSAVEQALEDIDVWLRRRHWIKSEYTDGTLPTGWLRNTGASTWTPQQILEYETAVNDTYSGMTGERHRLRLLPPGFEFEGMADVAERYKPEYDLYLLKLLCAHFDTTIAELGFVETGGLGSSGYHEGQADVQERKATRPTFTWLMRFVTSISRTHLRMPRELEFRFLGLEDEDEAGADQIAQERVQNGRMTLNEDRDRIGMPRYPFPEADMPMLLTQRGLVFIEGAARNAAPGVLVEPAQAPPFGAPTDGAESGNEDGESNGTPNASTAEHDASKADKAATSGGALAAVRTQLLEDYPVAAVAWLAQASWRGPVSVPLGQVDFSNASTWQAAHEPKKVARFIKKIRGGKFKPVVLIQTPGAAKLIVIDGHHRALAARQLGRPIRAWVGTVVTKHGAWDQMHAAQLHGAGTRESSKKTTEPEPTTPLDVAAPLVLAGSPPLLELSDAAAAELAAYARWAKRNPHPRRAFTFETVTKADAPHLADEPVIFAGGDDAVHHGALRVRQSWPGRDRTAKSRPVWAARASIALADAIDAQALAERWLRAGIEVTAFTSAPDASPIVGGATAITWYAAKADQSQPWRIPLILDWLRPHRDRIRAAIAKLLTALWLEGYSLGVHAARAAVTSRNAAWTWEPGDTAGARRSMNPAQRESADEFIAANHAWIESITEHRIDALALLLADQDTTEPVALAARIRHLLGDDSWASALASTELQRAAMAGTVAEYAEKAVDSVEWVATGANPCPSCLENSDAGPQPLNSLWPSGDAEPPIHVNCSCELWPVSAPRRRRA